MPEFIIALAIGILIVVIGIFNMFGHISMLHSYHRKRVSEEDRLPFGRLVGIGMICIGVSIIINGALSIVTLLNGDKIYLIVGTVIMVLGLILGTALAFYAMKKYNKGIF